MPEIGRPLTDSDSAAAVEEASRITSERAKIEQEIANRPIAAHEQEIIDSINKNIYTLIIGGTASGKTLGGIAYARKAMGPDGLLISTQPRRSNVTAISARVAAEAGVEYGQEVGYQHGDARNVSERTGTIFEPEGTLLQQLLNEPLLKRNGKLVTHVFVDEIHERSKDTEKLLLALQRTQELRQAEKIPPLKIIAASATVDREATAKYLGNANVVEVAGINHPLIKDFAKNPIDTKDMPSEAAQRVAKIVTDKLEGDIMIFVTGKGDIDKTKEEIEKLKLQGINVIELHANATDDEKAEIEKESPEGIRRVIIATNFAETGITVKGLKHVIDTGEKKELKVDTNTNLTYLTKSKISQAECIQRGGRSSRLGEGYYWALFTEDDYNARDKYPTPEMLRTDLTDIVLFLKRLGMDPAKAQFLSSPLPPERLEFAEKNLDLLGALNTDGTLNEIGKKMAEIPADYHWARMMVEAEKQKKGVEEACTIAAVAEVFNNDISDEMRKFQSPTSDLLTYLQLWEEWDGSGKTYDWAKINHVSYKKLKLAEKARDKYLERVNYKDSVKASHAEVENLISVGFADRLAKYDPRRKSYKMAREGVKQEFVIDSDSGLNHKTPGFLVFAENSRVQPNRKTFISGVQAVDEEDLIKNGLTPVSLTA